MSSKLKNIQSHAKRRFYQRIGEVLTDETKSKLISMIGSGKAVLEERQSNRISIYRTSWNDVDFRMVYDSTRKEIVTVLTDSEFWDGIY
jgi:hypothetical protein